MLFDAGMFIGVERERCLNDQHNGVGCGHCVSHCPGEALNLVNNRIELEKEKCLGCGLCFSECPTGVFYSEQWDERTVLTEVKNQGAIVTQFFCEFNEEPYLSKKDKEKGAVQMPACLGSISKGAWYEIGLLTNVELRLEKCHECPMKSCNERLQYSVETAMEWLTASGHTPSFIYIEHVENVYKKKKLKAVSTGMKVTSRRNLFLSLFGHGVEAVEKELGRKRPVSRRKGNKRVQALPQWQKRLEESYTSHFHEGGTPAYWPAIQKKETCVNCGMCSSYCPTRALQIKKVDGKVVHLFTAGRCLDCRLCMLFCPTESIIRDREPNFHPFEEKMVLEAVESTCRKCGQLTFEREKDLCYFCENEAKDADMLSDVLKHLVGS